LFGPRNYLDMVMKRNKILPLPRTKPGSSSLQSVTILTEPLRHNEQIWTNVKFGCLLQHRPSIPNFIENH
jgi:hypothetical protein